MQKAAFLLLLILSAATLYPQTTIYGLHYKNNKPVRITVENGLISAIEYINQLPQNVDSFIISPGFFDNQVNGFNGVSFSLGNSDLTAEGVEIATQSLWARGVTSYMPTLTTHSKKVLKQNFKILANAMLKSNMRGAIPGFHLEGPYINPEDGFRGAHPQKYVRLPNWSEFEELNRAANGKILQVTVAPEMDGAQDFIKKCTQNNIVVALGHHNGNAKQINEAVKNGAKISTHLGNGCANMINRHRNPLWPQLANDNLMISIICDGFHLLPEEIKLFYAVKGPEKTIVTSDVTSYAGLEPGEFKTQTGEIIELTAEGMLRYPAQNVLYGSASPITKGVGHIMEVTGCSLANAIKMASSNPAKLYGLTDRGVLEVGKRADVILFTIKESKIEIQKTYVFGDLVFEQK